MMRPAVAVVMPSNMWIVVVLPAPLGPSRPMIRPFGIANDTRSTARKPLKSLTRFSTWSNGVDIIVAPSISTEPSGAARTRKGLPRERQYGEPRCQPRPDALFELKRGVNGERRPDG